MLSPSASGYDELRSHIQDNPAPLGGEILVFSNLLARRRKKVENERHPDKAMDHSGQETAMAKAIYHR